LAKFYLISPIGYSSPDLYPSFVSAFEKEGHTITNDINEVDVVFFDLHTRLFDYDNSVLADVLRNKLPVVSFCEFDFGGMSKEVYPAYANQQQDFFGEAKEKNIKLIHFVRKMDKTKTYPQNIFPYEKCIMNDFPLTTSQELFSRPYDIFFIGNVSTTRANMLTGLLKYKTLHIDCHWTNEKGKIPHEEWLNRSRGAKLFVSCCGGGFSDERPYQLTTIAPMLKNKSNHLQPHPFTDMVNCVEVDEVPTEKDIEKILSVLNDENKLFEIYSNGAEHLKKYYTEEGRANYILKTLSENNII